MRKIDHLRSTDVQVPPREIYADLYRDDERYVVRVFLNNTTTPSAEVTRPSEHEARAWFDGYCIGRRAGSRKEGRG